MTKEEAIRLAKEEVEDWGFEINEPRAKTTDEGIVVYTHLFFMKGNIAQIRTIKGKRWVNAGDESDNGFKMRSFCKLYPFT